VTISPHELRYGKPSRGEAQKALAVRGTDTRSGWSTTEVSKVTCKPVTRSGWSTTGVSKATSKALTRSVWSTTGVVDKSWVTFREKTFIPPNSQLRYIDVDTSESLRKIDLQSTMAAVLI